MRSYQVVVSNLAMADLDGIASYVANLYRPDSGHKNNLLYNNVPFFWGRGIKRGCLHSHSTDVFCIFVENFRYEELSACFRVYMFSVRFFRTESKN